MKLIVLIVGLVAVVPINDREVMVLVPDARVAKTEVIAGHDPIVAMAHQAGIAWVGQDPWNPVELKEDLAFGQAGDQIREDWSQMIHMSNFLGSANAGAGKVKADCLDEDGCPQVLAQIRLSGGKITVGDVALRPVGDDNWKKLLFTSAFQGMVYNSLELPANASTNKVFDYLVEGSSALLFEMDLPAGFELEVNGQSHPLTPLDPCYAFKGDRCAFVRIWNVPADYLEPVCPEPPPAECDGYPKVGDTDAHFLHFFDLLAEEPNAIRLPRVAFMAEYESGNKPSIKCPKVALETNDGPGLP